MMAGRFAAAMTVSHNGFGLVGQRDSGVNWRTIECFQGSAAWHMLCANNVC